jgi:hypothetical protein
MTDQRLPDLCLLLTRNNRPQFRGIDPIEVPTGAKINRF